MNALVLQPSLEEFRTLAGQGNLIPVYTDLVADVDRVDANGDVPAVGEVTQVDHPEPPDRRARLRGSA